MVEAKALYSQFLYFNHSFYLNVSLKPILSLKCILNSGTYISNVLLTLPDSAFTHFALAFCTVHLDYIVTGFCIFRNSDTNINIYIF